MYGMIMILNDGSRMDLRNKFPDRIQYPVFLKGFNDKVRSAGY